MFEFTVVNGFIFLAVIGIIFVGVGIYFSYISSFDNAISSDDYTKEEAYTNQVKLLTDTYASRATARKPVSNLLSTNIMPEIHQNLINFHALGCRFTGYIGPIQNGYFDPDIAIQQAVNAGCRVFVLDIDYVTECDGDSVKYYPRIVARDAQGKMLIKFNSNRPICNSAVHSNLKKICEKINFYAYSDSCENRQDPLIIVLYFLRQPPGAYNSKLVLDYFSNVAKNIAPFRNRMITNELGGGTFYRQKQESRLLINKITDYNGKVLIFSNANTSGFRESQAYSTSEDLDYLVNLRLSYRQTKLGVTETEAQFGILETAEDYMIIPNDRTDQVAQETKLKWTICFPADPTQTVPIETYQKITSTMGVNCVPALLFDTEKCAYLFKDPLFKSYSFMPKPLPIRYIKPPVVVPAEPNPSTNTRQGKLLMPSV